ncbi:type IV pilin protein [Halomonas cibimaris]|uniref:Type IV pilin protein n=1 Tax=Halomonas cibimaris TaxID=657012 RepID=A0ABP7LRX6_9GAMM
MPYPFLLLRADRPFGRQRGFTLIELLVVVVILGILAAIAYPAYTQYVERSQRADAQAVMLEIAGKLERCYTKNYSYKDCEAAKDKRDDATSELYTDGFRFRLDLGSGAYKIVAEGGKRAKDGCETLTLKDSGAQLPEGCW